MNTENSLVISWTKANGLESLRTVGLLSKLNTPLAILKSMLNVYQTLPSQVALDEIS